MARIHICKTRITLSNKPPARYVHPCNYDKIWFLFFVFFWLLNLELVVKSFVVPQRPSRLKDRRRMNLECFPPK